MSLKTSGLALFVLSCCLIANEGLCQQPRANASSPRADFFKIPDSVFKLECHIYDFTLLPYAVPCVAINDGLFMLGINDWLVPPHSMPIRSILYDDADSSIFLLSNFKKKTLLTKLSLNKGSYKFIDSLDGSFSRIFAFSNKYILLSGKEEGNYGLWLYSKQSGFMTNLYKNKAPVTFASGFLNSDLLIACAGMVLHFDNALKVKKLYPVGFDIDGLTVSPRNEIIISTINGIISVGSNQNAQVLLNKLHGLIEQYNGYIYVLDAGNKEIIKLAL
jgi:hypothetical protein